MGPDLGPNCLQRLSADDKKMPPAVGKELRIKMQRQVQTESVNH